MTSLVICKSRKDKGLSDDGIEYYYDDYSHLSRSEKESWVRNEQRKVIDFGSRWNNVLTKIGLPPIISSKTRSRGGVSESVHHKKLKKWIRDHPSVVDAKDKWESFEEYSLPTSDTIDVLFKSRKIWIAVEAKSRISDKFPFDYERGLYQIVKYNSLLEAMRMDIKHGVPSKVKVILVLESSLPSEYRPLQKALGITVIENVRKRFRS